MLTDTICSRQVIRAVIGSFLEKWKILKRLEEFSVRLIKKTT